MVLAKDSGVCPSFLTAHLQLPLWEPGVDFQNGARRSTSLAYGVPTAGCEQPKIVIRSVAFLSCPLSRHCFGAFAAPGVREASALLPHPSGSGSPGPVPPEKQLLVWGAAPTRFRVPETKRAEQEKRMYLNGITLTGFLGSDAERKAANSTNIAIFSLATKTSWKNDAGTWGSRIEWHRCVAFGKLADFAGTLAKGAHVAIEGELRSHEYQRELAVGSQKTTITPSEVSRLAAGSSLRTESTARRCPAKGHLLFSARPAAINHAVS
jgi:single-strand DNA-binding protein